MTSLGACPPWAVLESMIDGADSDRNGKVLNQVIFIKTDILFDFQKFVSSIYILFDLIDRFC